MMSTVIELTINDDGTLDLEVETGQEEENEKGGETSGQDTGAQSSAGAAGEDETEPQEGGTEEQGEGENVMHPANINEALKSIRRIAEEAMKGAPGGEEAGFKQEMANTGY